MSVVQLKRISVPFPVVNPPRLVARPLHRLHVRWRWFARKVRNAPLPPPAEPGERFLAAL
ncbi:MAG TPA: hypothetical protein VEB22_08905 [Phycisphaerales bacterium]|nr:hypothetical protein [Phycisphaerales bacterium]